MTRIFQLCATLLLALAAAGAQAANYAGTTFEIEMIVFERPNGMKQTSETWPTAPRLKYPRDWVNFDTSRNGSLFLAPAAKQLGYKAAALDRSGNYRVLFHKAWRQVLQQKHNSPAILISGGDRFHGHSQLEGSVTISVSHYLHLSADLWLSEFDTSQPGTSYSNNSGFTSAGLASSGRSANESDNGNQGILLPKIPRAIISAPTAPAPTPGDLHTAGADLPSLLPVYATHVAQIRAERRLLSGDLHYIDHPAFGVLIQIRKVEAQNNSEQ